MGKGDLKYESQLRKAEEGLERMHLAVDLGLTGLI